MKIKRFEKAFMALMVSACAARSYAVQFDVSTGQSVWTGQTFNQSVTFIGNKNITASQPSTDGVSISSTNVQGALLNSANISMDGGGQRIRGLIIDGAANSGGNTTGGTFTGDVVQGGTLSLNNLDWAEGFEVGNATIGGNVVNSGKIVITGRLGLNNPSEAEGIYLHGTTIGGDFSNTGSVDVTASYATGLILDQPLVSIAGKLLNSGTIRATGENAIGLDIDSSTSKLNIENSGLISANGNNSTAVQLPTGSINYLLNTGTIESKGTNGIGFYLSGVTFTQNLQPSASGIINRGVISAETTTILVHPKYQTSPFEINQQAGEISSSSGTAIDASNLATLNWTGGKIVGDLLNLNGINIAGQADFTGTRIISPVSINSGSLNLSAPGTVITGNLNIASGAGIDMRLANSVISTQPYVTVNGVANFAQASKVTLSAKPSDFTPVPSGTEYTLLKASSVQNNGLTVSSTSSLLDVLSYSSDAQTVKAVVGLKSNQQVQQVLNSAGATAATVTAVNTLKNSVLGQLSSTDPVFSAFTNAGTAEQLAQIGEQLKPDVNRGALDVALSGQTVINDAILNRLSGQRESHEIGGVWLQSLSSNMDQGGRNGNNGYSANSSGMAVGADGRLNDRTILGLAYSYLNSNIHSDVGNKTEVQGSTLSLYGNWSLQNWFVDGGLSYGHNDNDSKRHVADTTARGNYGSDALSANVLGGYTFKLSDAALIEPRVAARYSNVRMDGFNEKGSSAALNTGSQHYEVGELGAGLRLAGNVPLTTGSLQPETTLMAYHDLVGDRVSQTSSYVLGGAAFTTTGASVARESYEASVGISYQVSAFTVGASYSRQARSGFDADGAMLKARYTF